MENKSSTNKEEKVAVYIDGNNFYKYLKDKESSFPGQKTLKILKRKSYYRFREFQNFISSAILFVAKEAVFW